MSARIFVMGSWNLMPIQLLIVQVLLRLFALAAAKTGGMHGRTKMAIRWILCTGISWNSGNKCITLDCHKLIITKKKNKTVGEVTTNELK